jgi:CBS domain-containing protein
VVVGPDVTLGEFMDNIMFSERHTTYPVVADGRPVGLLPFRCVANVPRNEWDTRHVRDCQLGLDEAPVLREDEEAVDVLAELSTSRGHALVVSNSHLAGIVSTSDLVRALEARPRRRVARTRALARVGCANSVDLVSCARGVGRSTGFALLEVAQRGRVRKGAKN